jgi:hypothetical protein
VNAVAQAMKSDGDTRPIDAIRADLATALLHGTPLPEAAADLHTNPPQTCSSPAVRPDCDSACDRPGGAAPTSQAPCGCADRGPGGGDGEEAGLLDAVRDVRRLVADQVVRLVDARLSRVAERARRSGHEARVGLRVKAEAQSIHEALRDLKQEWCPASAESEEHGHPGYRPPARMRADIQANWKVCAFPTCRQPTKRCDLDHTTPWHKGGDTCHCNLAPLCRHHHKLKQDRKWLLLQPWPGVLVWLTPAGKWEVITPD